MAAACVSGANNGTGINADSKIERRMFERLTRRQDAAGNGVGLALVKRAVTASWRGWSESVGGGAAVSGSTAGSDG